MARTIRLLIAGALTMAINAPASTEENFKQLNANQIRARVIGKDITDGVHWSEYYRKDGALVSVDMGTQRTGTWKIQGDKLCKTDGKNKQLTCYRCGCRATISVCGSRRRTLPSSVLSKRMEQI